MRDIADLAGSARAPVVSSRWGELMLEFAMSHPSFKTQLFRFVDVFPAVSADGDVLRHLEEYLEEADVPRVVDLGLAVADHLPFGPAAAASVARRNITRIAHQFIVGRGPADALPVLEQLWRRGSAATVDLLGEKTLTDADADRYVGRVAELLDALVLASAGWPEDKRLDHDDLGRLPRANVSVKPTALAARFSPLTREEGLAEAEARLRPVLDQAVRNGAFVHFDAEHYQVKDLTLDLVARVLESPAYADLDLGVVVQAYLKDASEDLDRVIEWSARRRRPLTVRLVKGAYWDTETVHARASGWPVPVFEDKRQTDASYERCTRTLLDHHGQVRAAFGTHNIRSIAHAVAYARSRGLPDSAYEIQLLYGMAAPLHEAVRRLNLRLRVYAPVGELVPGMAYLVRRLLENTANESFVRQRFVEGVDLTALTAPPDVDELPSRPPPARRAATEPHAPGRYEPEPSAEWHRESVRSGFAQAVTVAGETLGGHVDARIAGERVSTSEVFVSVDPGRPDVVVATAARCGPPEVDRAFSAAAAAWPAWSRTSATGRAAVLFRAAEWMRSRRFQLAALQVYEAAKPWPDADADVGEAIDFCEYYGREMIRLASGGAVDSPPGERNALVYQSRGVGAVIAPWNFPLAIPTGMVAAALVTGNCVLFKPAEQTPAVGSRMVEAFAAAGLPDGVLAFLPGFGEEAGAPMVEHPGVAFVAFTGSKDVGLKIIETAAHHRPGQRQVKRVVAEMGGKNAIVVDDDADLDQAVPIVVESAFGYAGQKCSACSRLIVLEPLYDRLLDRLAGAIRTLRVGHAGEMGVRVGPLIDGDAQERVRGYLEIARRDGRIVASLDQVPEQGWYVGPTVVADIDRRSPVVTDEIFGPVLAVLPAGSLEEAIALANDTAYALTAGIVSRSPTHVRQAMAELRGGNIYVNRAITGAIVGRHPFGGYGMSGVGSKAGGPDYLLQFLEPRTISENTIRQGFAPAGEEGAR